MCIISTTAVQIAVFLYNQILIFANNLNWCDKVYAVEYMVVEWDIYCNWAITIYEIAQIGSLAFYIYLCMVSFDHYHMGFHSESLKAAEYQRLEQERQAHLKHQTEQEKLKLLASG